MARTILSMNHVIMNRKLCSLVKTAIKLLVLHVELPVLISVTVT